MKRAFQPWDIQSAFTVNPNLGAGLTIKKRYSGWTQPLAFRAAAFDPKRRQILKFSLNTPPANTSFGLGLGHRDQLQADAGMHETLAFFFLFSGGALRAAYYHGLPLDAPLIKTQPGQKLHFSLQLSPNPSPSLNPQHCQASCQLGQDQPITWALPPATSVKTHFPVCGLNRLNAELQHFQISNQLL